MAESYRKKVHWSDETETEWRLERDAIVQRSPGREPELWLRLADIRSVRLWNSPLKYLPWRKKFQIHGAQVSMTFDNTDQGSWSSTENRTAEFVEFIRVLLWRLPSAAPQAEALWGPNPYLWAVSNALGVVVVAFVVLTFLPLWSAVHWAVRLLVPPAVLFFLWSGWADFMKNRPRVMRMDELANFLDEAD